MIFAEEIRSAVSQVECERLAELATSGIVLEIGAEYGRSTIAMASTAAMVWSVDWHLGDQASGFKDSLPEFVRNLDKHDVRGRVVPVVGLWEHVAHYLAAKSFDMVFHDGRHDGEAVWRDLMLAARILRVEGIMVVHDTDQPVTEQAVHAWAHEAGFVVTRSVGSLTELRWGG